MPAAAVIPAPIAYIKVVAVKKLVVGSWNVVSIVCREGVYGFARSFLRDIRFCYSFSGGILGFG